MRIKSYIITCCIFLFLGTGLQAKTVNNAIALYAGMVPSIGGNLTSYNQAICFQSPNGGVDGMNRSKEGYQTSNIDRLTGISAGMAFKTLIQDYYFIKLGFFYSKGVVGGKGKTVFADSTTPTPNYYTLNCKYSFSMIDVPLLIGLSIPFWKDMKISLGCGIAYARGNYKNKFESDETPVPFKREGSFIGSSFPLVINLEGDYFLNENVAVTSSLYYYRGSTKLLEDKTDSDTTFFDCNNDGNSDGVVDYSRIDFTGYRVYLGVSFYIDAI